MPLCPQITNTPITVTQTGDFTVSSVLPVVSATTTQLAALDAEVVAADAAAAAAVVTANAAASAAGAAQATANTALANAVTAYNAAVASLQPSASTIVNASNQMTAIAANGITVYSGSSASSGARVVLNSTGLAGFNSGGTATFSISASTGAAVFSGSVTGATITGSDLNIAGVFLVNGTTGVMTATSATITGTINAISGYFGSPSNGFSISATGLVGVGTGTIVGGAISGTTFTNGSTFSVTSAGVLSATSGTIGGFTLSASSIYAGTSLVLNTDGTLSGGNSATLFYGYVNIGGGTVTGERLIVTGNSSFVGQAIFSGNTTSQTHFYSPYATNVTSAANGYWVSSSGRMTYTTASSQRYKHDIVDLVSIPEYDPKKLLNLPVRAFRYNEGYVTPTDDRAEMLIPGFIAEEVDAIYPIACDYSETKGPESWNDRIILPGMLALIQDLYKEIDTLKGE